MKGTIRKCLAVFNLIVIVLLVLFSVILLYTSGSPDQTLFGYSLQLTQTVSEEPAFVAVKPGDLSLSPDDWIIVNEAGGSSMKYVLGFSNGVISYTHTPDTSVTMSLDAASAAYGGRVTFQSGFLGTVFSAMGSRENVSLSFVLIGGIFLICLTILAISYALYRKRHPDSDMEEEATPDTESSEEKLQKMFPYNVAELKSILAWSEDPAQQHRLTRAYPAVKPLSSVPDMGPDIPTYTLNGTDTPSIQLLIDEQ